MLVVNIVGLNVITQVNLVDGRIRYVVRILIWSMHFSERMNHRLCDNSKKSYALQNTDDRVSVRNPYFGLSDKKLIDKTECLKT